MLWWIWVTLFLLDQIDGISLGSHLHFEVKELDETMEKLKVVVEDRSLAPIVNSEPSEMRKVPLTLQLKRRDAKSLV